MLCASVGERLRRGWLWALSEPSVLFCLTKICHFPDRSLLIGLFYFSKSIRLGQNVQNTIKILKVSERGDGEMGGTITRTVH